MSPAISNSLIDLLLASGVPSREEATELSTNLNGGSWTTQVLDSGKVDEQRFLEAIGNFFQVPVISIDTKKIERSTLSLLPSRFVFQHHILPIETRDKTVVLATYDLFNSVGRQLASQLLKRPTEWVLVPRAQILRAMKSVYGVGAETFDEILKTNRSFETVDDIESATDLDANDPEASVVKFVNQIIREAILERATDIHVEPLEGDLRIRYRIDGILHEVAVPPQLRLLQSAIISRLKVMAHMDIAERRLPQDGRINLQAHDQNIDVRVSTIPTVNGESISLRLLSRTETQTFGFDRLDLSPEQTRIMKSLLAQPNGIILVTGPTGSGKSTSLYCFLSSINSVQRRIITIEEPVEYRLPGVSQIDVKPEIDLTFAKGLRHILRQDPNVVMVGEIRDVETADISIRAAMTGHLVFSTLHTNDAVGGITRLIDMDVEPEAEHDVAKSLGMIRDAGCGVGLTLNPATPFDAIEPYLPAIDLLLIMTVHPGFGGQAFRPEMMEKVRRAKEWRDRNGGQLNIEVDGGINPATAKLSIQNGANILVAGTSIFRAPDYTEAIRELRGE